MHFRRLTMDRVSILLEADKLINGERQDAYGNVKDNWQRTVNIFELLTGVKLSVTQGLMFMVAVKLAREYHEAKRDNRVDTCGYLELIDKVLSMP